jgi:hypothetical protein
MSLAFTAKLAEMLVMLKKQAEEIEQMRASVAELRRAHDAIPVSRRPGANDVRR